MAGDNPRWPEMYERTIRSLLNLCGADGMPEPEWDIDAAYIFFIFCYHLKDWIENDASIDPRIVADVDAFINASTLRVARDIANGVKHLVRNPKHPFDSRRRIKSGGLKGDDHALLVVGQDETRDALSLAVECMTAWDGFLETHGLAYTSRYHHRQGRLAIKPVPAVTKPAHPRRSQAKLTRRSTR